MLVSDEEGAVNIPFNLWADGIKKYIKSMGALWCPVFKIWKVPRVQIEFIRRDLPTMLTAEFENPPNFVKLAAEPLTDRIFIKNIKYEKTNFAVEEHPLYQKLYHFQRKTLEFCQSRFGRILIADEMGIGKSVQSLACSILFK